MNTLIYDDYDLDDIPFHSGEACELRGDVRRAGKRVITDENYCEEEEDEMYCL